MNKTLLAPRAQICSVMTALVVVAMLCFSAPAFAQRTIALEFTGRVVHVNDGDTVVAMKPNGEKVTVRLANIDAPETHKNRCKPGQPWAQKSTDLLARLVKGKTVHFACVDVDRYDRNVCDLQVGQSTANRMLVAEGLAWANRSNPRYLRDRGVADAERDAQSKGMGLWADPARVEPWVWRKTRWNEPC